MRVLGPCLLGLVALLAIAPAAQAQHSCACELPDIGGTAAFPPPCPDGYRGPWRIVDGLPAGTTIAINGRIHTITGISEGPGGSLGGTQSSFNALIEMEMNGTGALSGFYRLITYPTSVAVADAAPRMLAAPVQTFSTDLMQLQGQVLGDPDFDLLRITAGTSFGLPSPGSTTYTRLGPFGSNYQVDSFFDITWRIDFIGAPGGPLAGRSGSTTGQTRFQLCEGPVPVQAATWGGIKALY